MEQDKQRERPTHSDKEIKEDIKEEWPAGVAMCGSRVRAKTGQPHKTFYLHYYYYMSTRTCVHVTTTCLLAGNNLIEVIRIKPKNPGFWNSAYWKTLIFSQCGHPEWISGVAQKVIGPKTDFWSERNELWAKRNTPNKNVSQQTDCWCANGRYIFFIGGNRWLAIFE